MVNTCHGCNTGELAMELDNLETLCIKCHNNEHDRTFGPNKEEEWPDEKW